jgi:hypothetical protein
MNRHFALAALLLLWAACGVEDNPFGSDPDHQWQGGTGMPHVVSYWTETGGEGSHTLGDMDPGTEGMQDWIIVNFDQSMDPGTITSSGLLLQETWPSWKPVEITSVEYIPQLNRAIVRATFTADTGVMLTIPAGQAFDLGGNPLDPNRNGDEDGAPWDDTRMTLVAGAGIEYDITPPIVESHLPTGGYVASQLPEISIVISRGPLDPGTVSPADVLLLRTSDSSIVETSGFFADENGIRMTPASPLDWGERYTVVVTASAADYSGNTLDSNADGYLWPDEEDFVWDFKLQDDGSTHSNPPTVAGMAWHDTWVLIEFYQSTTHEAVVMDAGTYTAANIQVMDQYGLVPASFDPQDNGRQVILYFDRTPSAPQHLWVSADVEDQYGNGLDGNEDGLGGTPGEDDWILDF